ncbi:MAG: LacI family transcriptional regulator, partial [Cellulomonadaceae bacterium]|nr:LacI family transcriptional regulator [Cellulomonadaceae bacterium]
RVDGTMDALLPAGAAVTAVQGRENSERDAHEGALLLLDVPAARRPTAILCFSDLMAWGVVHAAQDLGLSVPADLSVVGFDDSDLARSVRPALTTVRQDLGAKGRAAAGALVAAIARSREPDGPGASGEQITIPLQLVVRHSTGPVPAST